MQNEYKWFLCDPPPVTPLWQTQRLPGKSYGVNMSSCQARGILLPHSHPMCLLEPAAKRCLAAPQVWLAAGPQGHGPSPWITRNQPGYEVGEIRRGLTVPCVEKLPVMWLPGQPQQPPLALTQAWRIGVAGQSSSDLSLATSDDVGCHNHQGNLLTNTEAGSPQKTNKQKNITNDLIFLCLLFRFYFSEVSLFHILQFCSLIKESKPSSNEYYMVEALIP